MLERIREKYKSYTREELLIVLVEKEEAIKWLADKLNDYEAPEYYPPSERILRPCTGCGKQHYVEITC